MKCQIIFYDDYGEGARIDNIKNITLRDLQSEELIHFGQLYKPRIAQKFELSFDMVDEQGKANYDINTFFRKTQDGKFIESKKDYKKRELESIRKLVKR